MLLFAVKIKKRRAFHNTPCTDLLLEMLPGERCSGRRSVAPCIYSCTVLVSYEQFRNGCPILCFGTNGKATNGLISTILFLPVSHNFSHAVSNRIGILFRVSITYGLHFIILFFTTPPLHAHRARVATGHHIIMVNSVMVFSSSGRLLVAADTSPSF